MATHRKTVLPSGLYVVEAVPEVAPEPGPEPPAPGPSCRGCGKPAPAHPHAYFGPAGWHHAWPTCGHPRYLLCPDCVRRPDAWRCGVCGGAEFYT